MANTLPEDEESARDNHVLAGTLLNIHRFKKKFTRRLSNKPFLIWLSTTTIHLHYVATLPCNLLLMDCFADRNVSQGSAATYARCGAIFNIQLTTKFIEESSSEIVFKNRFRFDKIVAMSLWPHFFGPPRRLIQQVCQTSVRSDQTLRGPRGCSRSISGAHARAAAKRLPVADAYWLSSID